jgi:hypothetical protein
MGFAAGFLVGAWIFGLAGFAIGGVLAYQIGRDDRRKRDGSATTLGQALVLTDGTGGQVCLVPKLPKGKKARSARLKIGETVRIETASNSSTVLEVGRDQDYVHPTQKPVELARMSIMNSSRPGEIVLDCFGGSGTSLIACEATGRKARLMELDPCYVDAEVKRWEDMTGRKAERQGALLSGSKQKPNGKIPER